MLGKNTLKPEQLYNKCDSASFEFETTEEVTALEGIIGQERAVSAMEFGLKIKRHGYNIFMTGMTGTGKVSYALSVAMERALQESIPDDWCYLYNFKNPGEPKALRLPAGRGHIFARDIHDLLDELKEEIPKAFNTEEYERQKGTILKKFQDTRTALGEKLSKIAQEYGFVLKRTSTGFLSLPVKEGKELSEEEFNQLEQSEREKLDEKSNELHLKSMEIARLIQNEEKVMKEQFKELEHKTGLHAAGHLIDEVIDKYIDDFPKVSEYLEELKEDLLANLHNFIVEEDEDKQSPFPWLKRFAQDSATTKYMVNLVTDNRDTKGAPVIVESNPTFYNLIGRAEHENRMGMVTTDFTMIKGGALHRANGGYLILQAKDVLLNFQSWEVLKRVLKTREIRIETIGEQLLTMNTLKPECIPLDVKVILIGNPSLYHLLYRHDEDFSKLFKIKADFDAIMGRSLENMSKMANFVSSHCQSEGLIHFDRSGVARIVEYSSRLAEHQEKLTTRFNEIVEILYEADAWAGIEGNPYVNAGHVEKAIKEKVYRSDKYEKRILEMVEEGQILLDFEGEKVGQINGLAVLDLGDYSFGRPSRITVSTYLGRRGIVNIERESKMSGRIHDKGVLIISGYIGEKYAQDIPLTLSAGICFEQSYEGVDGDSASSTELYALLSSLSGVPLKQNLAVSGSVNQKGEIQPVGGITRKIEGFFAACKLKGLRGNQGVIIPRQNMINLMLNEEVVAAVEEGKFHIYAVKTVEEGIEILTGMPAGERGEDGKYPQGTINFLVEKKIKEYHEMLSKQSKDPEKQEAQSKDNTISSGEEIKEE